MLIHGRAVHEGVKYSCGKCVYQSSSKAYIAQHKSALHEGLKKNILVDNVVIMQIQRGVLLSIKGLCMKDSKTLADNVVIRQLQREVSLSIKGLYTKESNSLLLGHLIFVEQSDNNEIYLVFNSFIITL